VNTLITEATVYRDGKICTSRNIGVVNPCVCERNDFFNQINVVL
jgi:hypothetical protein